ncbi:MAG: pyocin knob domain-containing protein [Pseudomonas sp.]|uniref:pyocin knob domain-containing protein n=1 Tax=Pseudomonas sp. TaxID=306 RepID=UPI003D6F0878
MPWYKSGVVACTLNSNAVIGTGTAFIANARVGDAFRGPDGGWYEVTNIASDTALSISPNYQGATNAAGAYALAPMQGYVKDSADALRTLVNAYGAKLAALGTTGNYDILPVDKGGTGGTTALGTAAFLAATTSVTDATSGRAVRVGDFGLGVPINLPPATDLNNVKTSGRYYCSTPQNSPAGNGWLDVQNLDGAYCEQTFFGVTGDSQHFRVISNNVPGPWRKALHDGTPPAFGLSIFMSASAASARTLLALSNAAIAPIVGSVSQSAGVPTGAIIERGSNAAGEFTKYADGAVIMSGRLSPAGLTWTAGTGVRYALSPNVTLPTPIVSGRIAFHTNNGDVSGLSAYVSAATLGTSAITIIYYAAPAGTTGSAVPTTDYVIHGRWF